MWTSYFITKQRTKKAESQKAFLGMNLVTKILEYFLTVSQITFGFSFVGLVGNLDSPVWSLIGHFRMPEVRWDGSGYWKGQLTGEKASKASRINT